MAVRRGSPCSGCTSRSEGLQAKDELVGIACIDVGKPSAAILYVSIPGTHRQFDWVVDDAINSVRML